MSESKLRIFVTTSHLSTVLMTMFAKESSSTGVSDILLVDDGLRRPELLNLIEETSSLHPWSVFHCFSTEISGKHDFQPSWRKNLIRKAKHWPIIKNIYTLLLQRHLRKKEKKYCSLLQNLIGNRAENNKVEIYLMTQTFLNSPLIQLFPRATIAYMEHGIGDYFYVLHENIPKDAFYAIFSTPYKKYLEKIATPSNWVFEIPALNRFPEMASDLLKLHSGTLTLPGGNLPAKPYVFILLEAVDMYNVPSNFWTDYLDHIIQQLDAPQSFHFLIKTHPAQSKISISLSEQFFAKRNFEYSLLVDGKLSSASAEVLFRLYSDRVKHVFCLFSSGCFYLSQLYQTTDITFWYSAEFFSRYIDNAPPQYKVHFNGLRPLIENVFAERCRKY
jgi:hypothetical protein